MESKIISATWPLMVRLFIYWFSGKEKQLLSGMRSLPSASQGYGPFACASWTSSLINPPQLLPGWPVLPSQALRTISCFSEGPGSRGPISTPEARRWFRWPPADFPQFEDMALRLSPSAREHISNSPPRLFLPLIPSLEARCCPGRYSSLNQAKLSLKWLHVWMGLFRTPGSRCVSFLCKSSAWRNPFSFYVPKQGQQTMANAYLCK